MQPPQTLAVERVVRTCVSLFRALLRLAAMKREMKVKELTLLDAARRRFLKHQQNQCRLELNRLDDEIQRKVTSFFHYYFLLFYHNQTDAVSCAKSDGVCSVFRWHCERKKQQWL